MRPAVSEKSRVPDLGRHRVRRASRQMLALMGVASMGATAIGTPAHAARAATPRTVPAAQVQRALASHALKTIDGKPLAWRTAENQVVIVNFWASWCAPCRRELPQLDDMHQELARQGARVIAVSIDSEAANARRFQQKHGLSLPIAFDGPDGLARTLDLPSIPYTVVLDRSGRVAWSTQDSDARALAELQATTRRLLTQDATAETAEAGRP